MIKELLADAVGLIAATLLSFSPVENIRIDQGGSVSERMHQIERIEKSGVRFVIDGMCISACTMYLGMKNVCVSPRTVLGFHSSFTQGPLGARIPSKYGNAVLMSYYPERVRAWVIENKALEKDELTPMTAQEAWTLGVERCE